jgi:hypothetical protein
VILLSGDVHFAQFYDTNCKSVAGGYLIPELTSSGLTHHANTFMKVADKVADRCTPHFWNSSELVMDLNFGITKIHRVADDIQVELEVRDYDNKLRLHKTFLVNRDLKFS